MADHGAAERHALLLAARELRRLALQQRADVERRGGLGHVRGDALARRRACRAGARPSHGRRCQAFMRRMASGRPMFSATVMCG